MASINTLIYENRAGSNVATLDQRPAPPAVEPSIMVSSPVPTTGMTTDPADPPKSDRTLVADEINRSHGSRYRGIIQNAQHARSVQSAYTKHIQSRQVTVDNDETYPTTTKQELRYVERMYYSIVDMRESWEVQKARLKKDKLDGARERTGQTPSLAENGPVERQGNKRKRAGGNGDEEDGDDDQPRSKRNKTTDLTGAESKLVSDNFDPAAQLEACLSYSLSDLEVEMLAWTLLDSAKTAQKGHSMKPLWSGSRATQWQPFESFEDRWAEICLALRQYKVLVKSLLSAEWSHRIASAPGAERRTKVSNNDLNAQRNFQRDVAQLLLREGRETKNWKVSSTLGLMDGEGNVLLEGRHMSREESAALAKTSDKTGQNSKSKSKKPEQAEVTGVNVEEEDKGAGEDPGETEDVEDKGKRKGGRSGRGRRRRRGT